MSSKELIKLLKSNGWYLDRTDGSHHIFKHHTKPGHLTIPHPTRDLGKGLVYRIKKTAGI